MNKRTRIALITALLLSLTGCNPVEPDTHLGVAAWTIQDAKYDAASASVTRAYAELLVSGYHEQPLGLTYTIDGKAGVGELALHRLPKGDAGTDLRTATFQGNFPFGTPLELDCYRVNNHTNQYHGLARFLLPMLEPGTHVLVATVTNEYGESYTDTKTFVVESGR